MHWFTETDSGFQQSIENGYYFSINEKMININKKRLLMKKISIEMLLLGSDAPLKK